MSIEQLDSENADRNLTAIVTVLTHTPSASAPKLCQGLVYLGDGTKNLDGTGGAFELTITVGGQTVQPSPQVVTFSTATRASVWTTPFPVPANAEVLLRVKSPNAADTDVDVTAYLYDLSPSVAQTGDSFPRIGATGSGLTSLAQATVCTEARLAELDAANLPTDAAAAAASAASADAKATTIQAKTDNLPAAPAAAGDIPSAATIADAVWDEAMVELSQAEPSATPAMRALLAYLYMRLRNRRDDSSTEEKVYDSAGTVIAKCALSDDGATFTKAAASTGP